MSDGPTRSSSARASAARSPRAAWPRPAIGSWSSSAGAAGTPATFPREPGDPLAVGPRTTRSARAAGSTSGCSGGWPSRRAPAVGGGSQIYANISIEADPATFEAGWPPEITYEALAPHYRPVARDDERAVGAARASGRARTALMARGRRRRPGRATGSGRSSSRSPSTRPGRGPHPDAKDPSRSRRVRQPRRAASKAPASISASATSAAPSSRATRSTSTTSPRAEAKGVEVRPLHAGRARSSRRRRLPGARSTGSTAARSRASMETARMRRRRGGLARLDRAAAALRDVTQHAAPDCRRARDEAGAPTATS